MGHDPPHVRPISSLSTHLSSCHLTFSGGFDFSFLNPNPKFQEGRRPGGGVIKDEVQRNGEFFYIVKTFCSLPQSIRL
jgi:hypothetical protein